MRADPSVFGDQYVSGKVDVADMNGFASQSPQMGGVMLTHILTEYQTAQEMSGEQVLANFQTAHQAAVGAESQVFGAVNRTNSVSGPGAPLTPGSSITFDYLNGTGNVIKSFTYTLDPNGTPF